MTMVNALNTQLCQIRAFNSQPNAHTITTFSGGYLFIFFFSKHCVTPFACIPFSSEIPRLVVQPLFSFCLSFFFTAFLEHSFLFEKQNCYLSWSWYSPVNRVQLQTHFPSLVVLSPIVISSLAIKNCPQREHNLSVDVFSMVQYWHYRKWHNIHVLCCLFKIKFTHITRRLTQVSQRLKIKIFSGTNFNLITL